MNKMERLLDIEDFEKFRKSIFYKFLNLFLTDKQKHCLAENTFITGMALASKIKYLRDEILDGDEIFLIKTDSYVFLLMKEHDTQNFTLAGPTRSEILVKKRGFFQMWDEMKFPSHIVEMIEKSKNVKEVRRALHKIMGMKAFW